MKIPLSVKQQYGQFAFQNPEQGVAAIEAIQQFLEEDHTASPVELRQVMIERDPKGEVMAAKSVKVLPNLKINLKSLLKDAQERLKEATNLTTIVVGGSLTHDWLFQTGAILYFIQFAIGLTTVKLTSTHAGVLVALHHLSGGELHLPIPWQDLQARFNLSAGELDEILENLHDLCCIKREKDQIVLVEKVVLQDR